MDGEAGNLDGSDTAGERTDQPADGKKRKPNKGCFGHGRDPQEGVQARKTEEPDPGVVPREPGMPDELYDMRHVAKRPARTDCSHMQRGFRKLFDENLVKFTQEKAKLEEWWRAKQEGRSEGAPIEEDMGHQEARALTLKCLRDFYDKNPDIPRPEGL